MCMETVAYFHKVLVNFGWKEEKQWPVTIGMNKKGGMDDDEFLNYFNNSLVPLYPYVKDESRKRVMLKVYSGPGRLNPNLLAYARNLGFIIYPGVPNTTAVTQQTDQNYGPFKKRIVENINTLSDDIIIHNGSTTLKPCMVGIVVVGGIDN